MDLALLLDNPELLRLLEIEDLADRARGDGLEAVCAYAELVFRLVPPAHLRDWFQAILDELRVGITAPPESSKTTGGIIAISWWIGKHPWTSSLVVSSGEKAAGDIANKVADTIEFNPMFAKVFPHVKPHKAAGWSSDGYEVIDTSLPAEAWTMKTARKKDPTLAFGGVGSASVNGKRVSGILWLDDIHDRKSKTSDSICLDVVDFVRDTALPRAMTEAHVVVVQTRWNPRDVIAYIKGLPHFRVFEHPAIKPDGTSYWPAQWPLERLEGRRAEIGEIIFELVYQGNDKAVEGHILKGEWLHAFPARDPLTGAPTLLRDWPRYFGIDPAKRIKQILSKKDDPDDFALSVFVDTGVRLVLEDVHAGVMFAPDSEDLIFAQAAIHRPKAIGIETNGLGNEYYLNLLRRMRVLGVSYVFVPIKTAVDMGERMSEVAPYFASGQIMVLDTPTPGLEKFRAQWLKFPHGHDDTLSAAHIGWNVAGHVLPASAMHNRRHGPRHNPFNAFGQQKG